MQIIANLSRVWVLDVKINMLDSIELEHWFIKDEWNFSMQFDLFGKDKEPFISWALKIAIEEFNETIKGNERNGDIAREKWSKLCGKIV